MKRLLAGLLATSVVVLIVGGLALAIPPFGNALFMWLRDNMVHIIVSLGILGLGGAFAYHGFIKDEEFGSTAWVAMGLEVILVILAAVYGIYAYDAYHRAIATSFEPKEITLADLGDTSNVRWNAFAIANSTAEGQQNDPTRLPGDLDPLSTATGIIWVGPRNPAGWGNQWGGVTNGVIIVDEDNTASVTPVIFGCAENAWLGNNIKWRLYWENMLAEYPEVFFWKTSEGQWLAVAPIVARQFQFPNWVPTWGGVMVMDASCNPQELTPEQAQADARLKGAQIFPSSLTRLRVANWGYRYGGVMNVWFEHQEQTEIHDLIGDTNTQPYYLETGLGRVWMVAAEPYGDTSKAVFKTFYFDVSADRSWVIDSSGDQALTGPERGAEYVQTGTSGYAWESYLVIEPRPVTKAGRLYWMYTVTTKKLAGTALVALVDARSTGTVLHFCTRSALVAWLAGSGKTDSLPCGGSNPGADQQMPPVAPVPTSDLSQLTDAQLWQLIHDAQAILEERHK